MIELVVFLKFNFYKLIILVYLYYLLEKYKLSFIMSNNIFKVGIDINIFCVVL